MKRLLSVALVGSLLLCAACGAVFVGGAIPPTSTVVGSITSVQLGSVVNATGGSVPVTFVTLSQSGTLTTVAFCNNQVSQFPLNQVVSVNFNPGQLCATIVVVVVTP
jgi:hypothetical protein